MSGLEVLLPIAAKAAAPIAGRLAIRAATSIAFRWRVARRVRAQADVAYSRRAFRSWLKSVRVQDLADPVERGAPRLARELDRVLSANAAWRLKEAHHSAALRLVEATYDAMMALTTPAEAAALRDHWGRAHHAEVVYALSQLLPVAAQLDPADAAELLVRESEARRQVRLEAFGLETSALTDAFRALEGHVPSVAPGDVEVIIGAFGSGKSELAETWFRRATARFGAEPGAPRPVWLHAAQLRGESLETALLRSSSPEQLTVRGVSVVVDGLDEVDGSLAAHIVSDVKVYVRTHAKSAALLTCRPGVLALGPDQSHFDGLDREDATLLIEAVAGSARLTWGWNPLLADAVRRPFFALAAGVALREGERPTGQAGLIARLVRRALGTGSSATAAVQSREVYELLVGMAVATTNSGNTSDGLSFPERQRVLVSTLVQHLGDDRLQFTLPIFQQWFAAQAVLKDCQVAGLALASPGSFDRWRWALAIAGVASSVEQLDDLLERVFSWNPGAGSWLLARIADGHNWFRSSSDEPIELAAAQARVLRSTRVVVMALGELAPLTFPVSSHDQPFTLGVATDGRHVSTGWLLEPSARHTVMDLPAEAGPFQQDVGQWRWDRTGAVPEGSEWPWLLPVGRVASATLELLNSSLRLGPEGGIWRREAAYRTARLLRNDQSALHKPFDRDALLASANDLLAQAAEPAVTLFVVGRTKIPGPDLLNLVTVLSGERSGSFGRLVPGPNIPLEKAASGWIWELYSDEQLQHFYAQAFGFACEAYDEAVGTAFCSIGWAMGTGAPGQFGVAAHLSFRASAFGESRSPAVTSTVVPLASLERAARVADAPTVWSSNRRCVVSLSGLSPSFDSWVRTFARDEAERERERPMNPFARGWSVSLSVTNETNQARPASALAASWLWSDLQAVGLGKGGLPQLR